MLNPTELTKAPRGIYLFDWMKREAADPPSDPPLDPPPLLTCIQRLQMRLIVSVLWVFYYYIITVR